MKETLRNEISYLVDMIKDKCDSLIMPKDGDYVLCDPNDNKAIEGHYAATHAAVSYLIYGKMFNSKKSILMAGELVKGILGRWDIICSEPDFHADFNLFALCLFINRMDDFFSEDLKDKIKQIVLNTTDSPHNTVNWLPMRAYVNQMRYQWTTDRKYSRKVSTLINLIKRATFEDYYVDDRIPVGISFNTQYDIATVATLSMLSIDCKKINVTPYINAVKRLVLHDGDVNYLGRGCNQFFAWGPWIYLLSMNEEDMLEKSIDYLKERLPTSIKNNNILLNEYKGEERWLWWDYHHFSVYLSHLFMWLMLALENKAEHIGNEKIEFTPYKKNPKAGIEINSSELYSVIGFCGRKEYLAERGPTIYSIWTKQLGILFKGAFAPWHGVFGNKNSNLFVAVTNYFGLLEVEHDQSFAENRILRKLGIIKQCSPWLNVKPLFCPYTVNCIENKLVIQFNIHKKMHAVMNIPLFDRKMADDIKVFADNKMMNLKNGITINNQYDSCYVYQTDIEYTCKWSIEITL